MRLKMRLKSKNIQNLRNRNLNEYGIIYIQKEFREKKQKNTKKII